MAGKPQVGTEQFESFADAYRIRGNGGIRGQTDESCLRDRGGGPMSGGVGTEPGADLFMIFVGWPKQRQQCVDIQEVSGPYHSSSISSTRFVVTVGESAGKTGK